MSTTSQNRAVKNYRKRLEQRGIDRFDVLGLKADRELIRALARSLACGTEKSDRIRTELRHAISEEPRRKGGVLAALRRSPLVGLELKRPQAPARKVEL